MHKKQNTSMMKCAFSYMEMIKTCDKIVHLCKTDALDKNLVLKICDMYIKICVCPYIYIHTHICITCLNSRTKQNTIIHKSTFQEFKLLTRTCTRVKSLCSFLEGGFRLKLFDTHIKIYIVSFLHY